MKLLIITQKIDKNDDILGFFHGWVAEFAKRCEKVTVIALGVGEYDLPQNVEVFSLGKETTRQKFKVYKVINKFKYASNFYKYIWQERSNYDTVFVHMNPEYMVLGGLLWKLMKKKRGLWYMHKSVTLKLRVAQILTQAIFSATGESFRARTNKLYITGHGIDIKRFYKKEYVSSGSFFKIITIGRISPIKDYRTLIDAMGLLQKKGLNVQLDIVGGVDGSRYKGYLTNLKQKIKEDGLTDQINFIGPVPNKNIVSYLHQADFFVNTSQTGSLDKAILEAMACGLVVFSSNDSAMNVLGPHRDKLFFKTKDKSDLAQKISDMITVSDSERAQIGLDLSKIVSCDHNLKKLIEKIVFIYQRI